MNVMESYAHDKLSEKYNSNDFSLKILVAKVQINVPRACLFENLLGDLF